MFQVNNSGKGNCMYFAYSISLMYFLRSKANSELVEYIFKKLKLKEEDKVRLQALLSKKGEEKFSTEEIETIIEPILGRATRDLAAEYTKQEFKSLPEDSSLFTAAKYGLEFCFKQSLSDKNSNLCRLIDNDFSNTNFTEAEIYKVDGTDVAMTNYSFRRAHYVIKEFRRLWLIKEQELNIAAEEYSYEEIKYYQQMVLDSILRKETVNFFLGENEKYLNLYKEHLQKEKVWGTEETLLVLHRAIQGERMVRNKKGTIDTFYDIEIVLHLHRNDKSPFTQYGNPVMILNNENNTHWTSKIPDLVFPPKGFVEKIKTNYPEELAPFVTERNQTGSRIAKALRRMYFKGLEGDEKYSPERCKEITLHYLNYVNSNNRHFRLTEVNLFLEDMEEIIKTKKDKSKKVELSSTLGFAHLSTQMDSHAVVPKEDNTKPITRLDLNNAVETPSTEVFTPYILQEYPIPDVNPSSKNKEEKKFIHPYSKQDTAMFYKAIYDWVDSLTEKSFKGLIKSTLEKYEAKIWGRLWGASRRSAVEGYLDGNCNAKALAMIFANGEKSSTLNDFLFVKIIGVIKKEIKKYPVMLEEEKYQLISQFDLEEHKSFYLEKLKFHHETNSALERQLEDVSNLTY